MGRTTRAPRLRCPRISARRSRCRPPQAASLADLKWFEVFKDEKLQELIAHRAGAELRSSRCGGARRAGARESGHHALESVSASQRQRRAGDHAAVARWPDAAARVVRAEPESQLGAGVAESAVVRGGHLGTSAPRDGSRARQSFERRGESQGRGHDAGQRCRHAIISICCSWTTNWRFRRRTLETRRDSLRLVQERQGGGVATLLDLRQAEQLVSTAAQTIPALQQQIEQTENQISLLLGKNPDGVIRGRKFMEQEMPPEVPAGMPSSLLERRPDIRAAEQALIAANANIGVAKAAYFPQMSLSGLLGGQSTQLASLFTGPHSAWSFVPQVSQPIFTAGRLKSGVKLAEAERDSALVQYEKTIQTAFTEVSNALIAHQRTRESRLEQERLVAALQDRKRLAYVRYRGGVDTQLNALDADRDLFQAELTLAQIRLSELLSVVQLYKALGGGWQ